MISAQNVQNQRHEDQNADSLALVRPNNPSSFPQIISFSISCMDHRVYASLIVILTAMGCTYLGLAEIPYHVLYQKALGASGGKVSFFTPDFYHALHLRLIAISAIFFCIAIFFLFFRSRAVCILSSIRRDISKFAADVSQSLSTTSKLEFLLLGYFVALGTVLRVPMLFQPMRYDEGMTFVEYASRPLYVLLSFYSSPNNHLFHSLLVHFSYRLFGNHPWALRLPAFAAGMAMVPISYFVARTIYRHSAVLTAGFIASSTILVGYSTNARGYSLTALFFLVMLGLAAYILRTQNWTAYCLLAVISAIGFYTIPIMLYPFAATCLWMFLSMKSSRANANWHRQKMMLSLIGTTGILSFILYSPVFAVSGVQAVIANKFVKAPPYTLFLHGIGPSLISTWQQWNWDLSLPVCALLVSGFIAALALHRRCSVVAVSLPLTLMASVAPLIFVQHVIPFERVWLFALPLYLMVCAGGIGWVISRMAGGRSGAAIAFTAIMLCSWIAYCSHRNQTLMATNEGRGLEEVAGYLKSRLQHGDSVLTALQSNGPLSYYFQAEGIPVSQINATQGKHFYVVVNRITHESLRSVMDSNGLASMPLPQATWKFGYDTAELYEVLAVSPPGITAHGTRKPGKLQLDTGPNSSYFGPLSGFPR